jgi:hypothetical protein
VKKLLNIIYRICEAEADGKLRDIRPHWYSKQKCLKSFIDAIEFAGDQVGQVIFLHDGDGQILLNLIPDKYEIRKTFVKNNRDSLYETFDIADEIGGSIYFVEDDYLHKPESILEIAKALPELKLVTGYDHAEKYTGKYHAEYGFDIEKKTHGIWQTAEFACCTYAVDESIYKIVSPTMKIYGLWDTKLFKALHTLGIPLWSSKPGLTTQVDRCMSPGVDWEEFNKNV